MNVTKRASSGIEVDRPSAGAEPVGAFAGRHIGPDACEIAQMLESIGCPSLDALIEQTIPDGIRCRAPLALGPGLTEDEAIRVLGRLAASNRVERSCIGMGYHDTITPPVIGRNILENPGWYTQYTPYQAEIAQGRLEALLNFQTMVADLTGLPVAGASLLDEATAGAEAMAMCHAAARQKRPCFLVDARAHPQTIAVMQTRAESLGIDLRVARSDDFEIDASVSGVLVQYPATDGRIEDPSAVVARAHDAGALVVVAADLLALTLLKPPGEFGADICVGSAQRFGVPMGGGGPHPAFLSTTEAHVRRMPGRIIGVSHDRHGDAALRMAIQTREQHIKRERATSNICTAQALLAIIAGMYAVYHGPDGIRRIGARVHRAAQTLGEALTSLSIGLDADAVFDTIRVRVDDAESVRTRAAEASINFRYFEDGSIGIALDETTDDATLVEIVRAFVPSADVSSVVKEAADRVDLDRSRIGIPGTLERTSGYLTHPVFNTHHSETELLRYIFKLQGRDLSLAHSMIALGSCTMKLNATSEMLPISWPEFSRVHPFAPDDQMRGYSELFRQLEAWLGAITGLPGVSLQPNAGSQGEYAGLMVIRAYHADRGEANRNVCLIPTSAHGTNPASAVIAGMKVVPVNCDKHGNIDVGHLRAQAETHRENLAALMITYPSTHGVFEAAVSEICDVIHEHGGQVYLDGANMNAQVCLCRPGDFGADVCHLNLHKTFCIPHGGGGPGMGPICAAPHLTPYLPGHPVSRPDVTTDAAVGAIAAAPYGSPSILPISWMYIAMMGEPGLRRATEVAILNANYMAERLRGHYDILFTGESGRVAHEFIVDCRPFEKSAGVRIDDIAKRLIDYGFHAPTMSWPVAGTLMIEPTESEAQGELDRFCDAMIAIREEIRAIEQGDASAEDNVLLGAPHTVAEVSADSWSHPYGREQAAFPRPWVREHKFWPSVGRIDNAHGDRNLICTCEWDPDAGV